MPLGAVGLAYVVPISAIIIAILLVVYFSYRQTIHAYPGGGGLVHGREGEPGHRPRRSSPGRRSRSTTCSTWRSASRRAWARWSRRSRRSCRTRCRSAWRSSLVLTVVNLRGTRESGFDVPAPDVHLRGDAGRHRRRGGRPGRSRAAGTRRPWWRRRALARARPRRWASWLLMRAFASGCTAMTGVEAVSNGVPIFREPTVPQRAADAHGHHRDPRRAPRRHRLPVPRATASARPSRARTGTRASSRSSSRAVMGHGASSTT